MDQDQDYQDLVRLHATLQSDMEEMQQKLTEATGREQQSAADLEEVGGTCVCRVAFRKSGSEYRN